MGGFLLDYLPLRSDLPTPTPSDVFLFQYPTQRPFIVGKHLFDAVVSHLVALEVLFDELVLLSDFFFVAHTRHYRPARQKTATRRPVVSRVARGVPQRVGRVTALFRHETERSVAKRLQTGCSQREPSLGVPSVGIRRSVECVVAIVGNRNERPLQSIHEPRRPTVSPTQRGISAAFVRGTGRHDGSRREGTGLPRQRPAETG